MDVVSTHGNSTTDDVDGETESYGAVVVRHEEQPITEGDGTLGIVMNTSGQQEVNGRQVYSSSSTPLPSFGISRSSNSDGSGNHKWPTTVVGLMGHHQRRWGKSIIMQ